MESISKIASLRAEVAKLRKEKHDKNDDLTMREERVFTDKIKALNEEIAKTITSGSEPCEGCSGKPHGMVQEIAVRGEALPYFEVGCLTCIGKRAQGFTPEQAVSKWNDENYLSKK